MAVIRLLAAPTDILAALRQSIALDYSGRLNNSLQE
jgi:hypothetical protein